MKERFKIPENNTSFGKRYTKEEREKHSKACMGNNKGKKLQVWQIEYLRSLHLGKKDSHETRMKKRASMLLQREKHWNWKGGVWEGNSRIRKSLEIKIWREAVFARDNWTCQHCRKRGCRLEAHHIKSFARHPELRLAIDNGLTLCKPCHDVTKKCPRP